MTATILDGKATRDARIPELKARFAALAAVPALAIVQVGDRPDSNAYIQAKKSFAAKLGVEARHLKLPETVSQDELEAAIRGLAEDRAVKGIILQLPVPLALDQDAALAAIPLEKDVDGLSAESVKRWLQGREDAIMPATARGVKELLSRYEIGLFQKRVVVVGRSMLVGKPIAAFCLNENASVTVCHSKTADLAAETSRADVLVVAAGRPGLVGADHVKPGAVVIDVGINTVQGAKLDDEIEGTTLVGDVDFAAVSPIASALTPVPGGVGPMTVLGLFENLADLCDGGLSEEA